jgi:O-antigen chain-terminating methyltransferase
MRGVAEAGGFNQAAATTVDAFKYVGFEEQFRGSQHDIRARLSQYVALFDGASDVVDIGCGRGEFLELLRSRGVTARGVDLNQQMVAVCRERGLEAEEGDALGYLRRQADQSLGGLIAIQVVEHLQPDYLLALLDEAYRALRPGATMVLETINAASWFAFFQSYVRDITHVRPLHPDTLAYYVRASGFGEVRVQFSAPVPPTHRLRRVEATGEVASTVNANVDRLNELVFADLDYAVIAVRG